VADVNSINPLRVHRIGRVDDVCARTFRLNYWAVNVALDYWNFRYAILSQLLKRLFGSLHVHPLKAFPKYLNSFIDSISVSK
jgi:hypothetical protein